MQSPEVLANDNILPQSRTPKRKLSGKSKGTAASKETSQASSGRSNESLSSPKRLKTSHSSGNLRRPREMNKMQGIGSMPITIDLTRPTSSFQPHAGAKKLVIKNLRPTSKQDAEEYYKRTWSELDAALTATFNEKTPCTPLEQLCRGVQATCQHGQAGKLFENVRDRCKIYLEKQLLPQIERQAGPGNVDTLQTVLSAWTQWDKQSTELRKIFSFLDRSYLLNAKDLPRLEDLGIQQFREIICFPKRRANSQRFGEKAVLGMCDLIKHDRAGDNDLFDPNLLRNSISMLHIFGSYEKYFEPGFLQQSTDYFDAFVQERRNLSMRDYIYSCEGLLDRETLRCNRYNFDSSTKRNLLNSAHLVLIEKPSDILLDPEGLAKLIEVDDVVSLTALYNLLVLSNIQKNLKTPFENYIKKTGSTIVRDKDKVDDMVLRLLELKKSLDRIIRDAFNKDETFTYSLREAFGNFINDRKNTLAYSTSNSKVGEMIAKYMDSLLRGGLKAVPRSLTSDAKERDASEKQGQSSTADEDAELDRQLEQSLELFRFIEGKDVFEAFYKKDLARRLLLSRSASKDAEQNMLAKLKVECGYSFTHNLEQMFKDQDIAQDEMDAYNQWLSEKPSMDLSVTVLSQAAWPSYPDVMVNLPEEVAAAQEKYESYYKYKHTGRRLYWKPALTHSVVRSHFNKGSKELMVSGFQAIVLVLFNDVEKGGNLSYGDIQKATGLVDAELVRTLQSLACAKYRVLTKHPKGRDIDQEKDTFTVNLAFTDPKYRIKINQIQLKETKAENQETHEKVHQDRQYETQAAIVRIMKSRKTMAHSNLVSEVIEQTRRRGIIELSDIKKHIEKLIDKEYLERGEGNTYMYLA